MSPAISSESLRHNRAAERGALLGAAKSYLRLRPCTILDALRLYASFPLSMSLRLLRRPKFQSLGFYLPGKSHLKISLSGISMEVRPRTNDLAIAASTTEPRTITWFQVGLGDTVVDVGAHIGKYSLLAAKRASKVVAIEPEPSNFALLESNVMLNGFANVVCFPFAISDRAGHLRLYLGNKGNLGTWSTIPAVSRSTRYKESNSTEVQCDTLDHLIATVGLGRIDWLKIDVEGHEIPVLQGGKNTLAKARHIILEVTHGNEKGCVDLLHQAEFEIVSVEKGGGPTSNWLLERQEPK